MIEDLANVGANINPFILHVPEIGLDLLFGQAEKIIVDVDQPDSVTTDCKKLGYTMTHQPGPYDCDLF
jgi:hypothetical protein